MGRPDAHDGGADPHHLHRELAQRDHQRALKEWLADGRITRRHHASMQPHESGDKIDRADVIRFCAAAGVEIELRSVEPQKEGPAIDPAVVEVAVPEVEPQETLLEQFKRRGGTVIKDTELEQGFRFKRLNKFAEELGWPRKTLSERLIKEAEAAEAPTNSFGRISHRLAR